MRGCVLREGWERGSFKFFLVKKTVFLNEVIA